MDIAWYLRRLRRMSPAEIGARLRAAAIQQAWRLGGTGGPAVGTTTWTGAPLRGDRTMLDPEAMLRMITARLNSPATGRKTPTCAKTFI